MADTTARVTGLGTVSQDVVASRNRPLGSSKGANKDLGDREDWAHLRGGVVEVRLDGNLVRVGKVGQATADSTMLWIEADAVEQRALFVKSAGYTVRPHYGNANRQSPSTRKEP
jgi:hypothetical protein